jgi:hypothetical protein
MKPRKALSARQAIKNRAQAPLLFPNYRLAKHSNDTIAIENLVITD